MNGRRVLQFRDDCKDLGLIKSYLDHDVFGRFVYEHVLPYCHDLASIKVPTDNSTEQLVARFSAATSGRVVAAEGIAEQAGELTLALDDAGKLEGKNITFDVSLNVSITNKLHRGVLRGVALETSDGSTYPGILANTTSVRFEEIPLRLRNESWLATIRNIRVNPSQLGGVFGGEVQALVRVTGLTIQSVKIEPREHLLTVARPNVAFTATAGNWRSGGACLEFSDARLNSDRNRSKVLRQASTLCAEEVLPNILRPKGRFEDSGSRILARFFHVPEGARLFVTAENKNDESQARRLKVRKVPDASFAGSGGVAYTGTSDGEFKIEGGGRLEEVELSRGFGYAVWEVVEEEGQGQAMIEFGVAVMVSDKSVLEEATIEATINLAPVSTDCTASDREPIPRFVECVHDGDSLVSFVYSSSNDR